MHTPAHGPRTSAPSASTTPTNTSYTPGPWREHSHRQIGPDAGIVCEVWSAIGETDADRIAQADANVHLIAAAPELHQALKTLIADYRIGMAVVRPRTMTLIRDAMAKAAGGAA